MRTALRADLPDLILSDFSLPRFDGMSALAVAISEDAECAVHFSDRNGRREELAIEALKCGAIDYVLKSNPMRLAPAVKRALKDAKLRQKSQLAEQKVTRLTGVLQMLSGINTALVRIHDRDELLQETCRLAHKVGGYAIAIVALINPITRLARPLAWSGHDYLPDPAREFPVADTEAGDKSLMGRVIRTGETTRVSRRRRYTAGHRRSRCLGCGGREFARLPATESRQHASGLLSLWRARARRHQSG